jgi:5-methylcytosine-specific restriction protein A
VPNRPPSYRPSGSRQRQQAAAAASDAARGTAAQRGYGSRWQRLRLAVLAERPLCEDCKLRNVVAEATEVDHIDGKGPLGPRGYDLDNLRPLCKRCHSRKTARDNGGFGRTPTP